MTVRRLDNVGIVVEDLDAAIRFFTELGLELEGRGSIEGEWAGRVTGLGDQHVEVAMMRKPDGHGRLEISRFLRPNVIADHRRAPVRHVSALLCSRPGGNSDRHRSTARVVAAVHEVMCHRAGGEQSRR